MGVDDLIVAGSHGFDIWSRSEGTLEHEAGAGFEELIERVTERVREEADPIEGSLVEPKKAWVALDYRLVADADQRPKATRRPRAGRASRRTQGHTLDHSVLPRWPKAAGSKWRVIAADYAQRGEIATDDLRIVAARAALNWSSTRTVSAPRRRRPPPHPGSHLPPM